MRERYFANDRYGETLIVRFTSMESSVRHLKARNTLGIALALLALPSISAVGDEFKEIARETYSAETGMPMGVILRTQAQTIAALAASNPELAMGLLQKRGVFDLNEAVRMRDYLVGVSERIEKRTAVIMRNTFCPAAVAITSDADANRLLNALNDVEEAMYEEVYEITKVELDEQTSLKLDEWLENGKQGVVSVKFDHVKARANVPAGQSVELVRNACQSVSAEDSQ